MVLQMFIAEVQNEDSRTAVQAAFKSDVAPGLLREPGIYTVEIVSEDGGSMILILLFWHSREAACAFVGSTHHRQITNLLRAYVYGNPIVKLFSVN